MTVDRVAVNPNSQQRVVVLKAKEVSMYLPIWVGPAEGDSIMFKLRGEELPRPMTHDLMDSMISDLGARVTRVVVNAMQGDMFLGRIVLQRNGTTIERDSRPSDAIALAVRTGAAIYVEEEVLDRAGVSFDPETGLPTSTNANWTVRSIEEIDNAFSDEAKGLLRQAGANATRLGRKEITPEDILLALTGEPQGNGARVLADLGLDLAEARSKLGGDVESGEPSSSRAREFSEACQCVLSLARREAHMLFSGETGTEHILLGLALAEDGLASWILKDAGIEAEAVRAVMTGLPHA
jgi:bifunctional DNase/RNase